MMKARLMILWVGVGVLMMILAMGYEPAIGAPPTGEVKTVGSSFGNEIPIPHLEIGHANDWMQLLYDPLIGCTPEGKFSTDLGLANRWEMSPDGLTWTFSLRKGVKFHDGVELTAKDVKFSIEQFMLPEAAADEAVVMRGTVKSIEVKNPYTVVIHCKRPALFMDNSLSNMGVCAGMVVPKDYFEKVGKDEFAKHPIGSGPYKWLSQRVGSFIKLEAIDRHWRDGVPRYKYMTYLIIPEESTRMAMLKTGEADMARIGRDSVKEALSAGLNIVSRENAAVVAFNCNMQWTSPVFSDIRFRKALNLAIDKESIVKNIFGGLAKSIAAFPGSSISVAGGDLTLKPYPYDPQEARRLIKEGGWEGHEFTLISYPRAGCPEFPLIVEALAGYWQKIGLSPRIRMTDWTIWRKTLADRKSQNTVHGTEAPMSPDFVTLSGRFEDKWYFKVSRSTVNIPELNERFERIGKSMDVAEIARLLTEIYRYAYDQYLAIPICEIPDMIASTKRIPKWDPGLRRSDRNYYDIIKQ